MSVHTSIDLRGDGPHETLGPVVQSADRRGHKAVLGEAVDALYEQADHLNRLAVRLVAAADVLEVEEAEDARAVACASPTINQPLVSYS